MTDQKNVIVEDPDVFAENERLKAQIVDLKMSVSAWKELLMLLREATLKMVRWAALAEDCPAHQAGGFKPGCPECLAKNTNHPHIEVLRLLGGDKK